MNGGFHSHGGTPSHHPFLDGIFPYKPSSYGGSPMTMESPICWQYGWRSPFTWRSAPAKNDPPMQWKWSVNVSYPSGKRLDNYGKSPFPRAEINLNGPFQKQTVRLPRVKAPQKLCVFSARMEFRVPLLCLTGGSSTICFTILITDSLRFFLCKWVK